MLARTKYLRWLQISFPFRFRTRYALPGDPRLLFILFLSQSNRKKIGDYTQDTRASKRATTCLSCLIITPLDCDLTRFLPQRLRLQQAFRTKEPLPRKWSRSWTSTVVYLCSPGRDPKHEQTFSPWVWPGKGLPIAPGYLDDESWQGKHSEV